jgi:RNA polymerase sigma-70 factor (ECF subfamily)
MGQPDPAAVESWARRLRAGDQEAFGLIVKAYEGPLFAYLTRFTGDRGAAEDVFQEVFLRLHADPVAPGDRALGAWLYTVAHNLAVDWLRRVGRETLVGRVPDVPARESAPPAGEIHPVRLAEAIGRLPSAQRAVVCLRVYGELPFREIARILDAPLNTVLGRMHQATLALRRALVPAPTEVGA